MRIGKYKPEQMQLPDQTVKLEPIDKYNFNIELNKVKKDYQQRAITQQRKNRIVKPFVKNNLLIQPKLLKQQINFTQVNYPQMDQIDFRPIIKKKLLFLLYKILQQYSLKKSSLTNQQMSVFIYLVQNNHIEFLYPLVAKMIQSMKFRNQQVSNKYFQEVPQIMEEDSSLDSNDVDNQVKMLEAQLAHANQSFDEIIIQKRLSQENLVEHVPLTRKYESLDSKESYHLVSINQDKALKDEIEYQFQYISQQQTYSIKDGSPSIIMNNRRSNTNNQFLSSDSINQSTDQIGDIILKKHKSGQSFQKFINVKQKNAFNNDYYIKSNELSYTNKSFGEEQKNRSPVQKVSKSKDPAQANILCISIENQLDDSSVRQSNMNSQHIQKSDLQNVNSNINSAVELPPQSMYSNTLGSGQISQQSHKNQNQDLNSISLQSYVTNQLDPSKSSQQSPMIQETMGIKKEVTQSIISKFPQIDGSKSGLLTLDSIKPQSIMPVLVSSNQELIIKLKSIEKDMQELAIDKQNIPNQDKSLNQVNNLQIDKKPEKHNQQQFLQPVTKKSIQGLTRIETNKLEASSKQNSSKQQAGSNTGSARTINSNILQNKSNKKSLYKKDSQKDAAEKQKIDISKKKKPNVNDSKPSHERINSQMNNSNSEDQYEEDDLQTPLVKKQNGVKVSQGRKESIFSKKQSPTHTVKEQEAAKNKELEFLRQFQKLELERSLSKKYSSAKSLVDKRNMINELIIQLENEKVPEVKYQIFLYRQRLAQIKNQQTQMNEAFENQLENLPDCYDYLANNIKFSDNIRIPIPKSIYQQQTNTTSIATVAVVTQQDNNDYAYQNYNASDKQNELELQMRRKEVFLSESILLREYKNKLQSELLVIQSHLDIGGTVENINRKSIKNTSIQEEDIQQLPSMSNFNKKLNKNIHSLMKLSKPKILSLNEKFQEIKYISDVKSMLVDQTKGATMIKITM